MFCVVFSFEQSVHKDFQEVTVALEGERYRSERLEEQINDLTELHQVCLSSVEILSAL